jgi:dihydrodipicolinate synthase/N-acetylneuraminate lyase
MSKLLFCRNMTPFKPSGAIDEEALRVSLQRFIDAKVGLYVGSAGSAEANSLNHDELKLIYRTAVETCKGRVPVYGNPLERPTVRETLDHIENAFAWGVELVNVYGPPGWHGFRPSDAEYVAFFDQLLPQVRGPVALAPNTSLGYSPKPELIADIARRHRNVAVINLVNQGESYFFALKEQVRPDVAIYVMINGSMATLQLGAAGLVGGEFNLTLKTYRSYVDHVEAGRFEEAAKDYADIERLVRYVKPWTGAHPRWIKMAMHVLRVPGWEGGLRAPYLMPPPAELARFGEGLLRLRIREIDAHAKAAGITVPV